jgi:cytochrome b pre-mRNA-processing protein 3
VAQARQPAFFASHGVLDTPEGRTALIILLMFPALDRLQASGGTRERRLARYMSETFVTDIDDCLREMGVGDMSVPKKVKRAAQALGERCVAYRRAAGAPDPATALADELATTIPGLDLNPSGAKALALMTLDTSARLRAAPVDQVLAGKIDFAGPLDATNTTAQS